MALGKKRKQAGRRIGPAAMKLINEHGLDPADITGTGANGNVKKSDVEQLLAAVATTRNGGTGPAKLPHEEEE